MGVRGGSGGPGPARQQPGRAVHGTGIRVSGDVGLRRGASSAGAGTSGGSRADGAHQLPDADGPRDAVHPRAQPPAGRAGHGVLDDGRHVHHLDGAVGVVGAVVAGVPVRSGRVGMAQCHIPENAALPDLSSALSCGCSPVDSSSWRLWSLPHLSGEASGQSPIRPQSPHGAGRTANT